MQKLLSLIIPTNGVTEWVVQVVDSIYKQNIDDSLFEVVITDNGEGDECKNVVEKDFGSHSNLRYAKTTAKLFLNQVEAFKIADGLFVKFINHRALMQPKSVQNFIDYVNKYKNEEEKPITFFMNPTQNNQGEKTFDSFDSFVKEMSFGSSWSGGLAMWKEDFNALPPNLEYNTLFPHTTLLFYFTDRKKYVINYTDFYRDIITDHSKKGKYLFYNAFGVEYPAILLTLLRSKSISLQTFISIRDANGDFIAECYKNFSIFHLPHSYDLSGCEEYLSVFYNFNDIVSKAWFKTIRAYLDAMIRKFQPFK